MIDDSWDNRTELLLGRDKLVKLQDAHILVAGLGGVGSYVAELLCRAGVGKITIADSDIVQISNINRQIPALTSTIGLKKTEIVSARLKDINPKVIIEIYEKYLDENTISELLNKNYDYVVDAIDTLTPKISLISECVSKGVRLISSMGSAGKIDPSLVRIADISESNGCKLAYYVRKKLHKQNIFTGVEVVYSPEVISRDCIELTDGSNNKKSIIGTISYMPAMFGVLCTSVIIRSLVKD